MSESKTAAMATALSLALEVLSARVVLILAILMSFGLFSWAMALGSWVAVLTAAIFTALVFLPILWRSHGNSPQ